MHTLRPVSEVPGVIGLARWQFLSRLGPELRLVGGAVRDALLGNASDDLDLLIESPLSEFLPAARFRAAEALAISEGEIRIVEFPRFLTAKMHLPGSVLNGLGAIDIAQSRSELYPRSGAEPVVSAGDRLSDTIRRDFTVNAMAVRLGDDPKLDDPAFGFKDLQVGELRILHKRSFEDDPARIIRGIRFISRFGFHFEEESGALFHTAIEGNYLKRLPAFRLFDEFKKLLGEPYRDAALLLLESYGALRQILPESTLTERKIEAIREASQWEEALLVLTDELDEAALALAFKRFALSASVRGRLLSLRSKNAR